MTAFSIDAFASRCKQAMATAADKRAAARSCLTEAIAECGTEEIISALQQAVPADANVGELIVHTSAELTMLYGRVPARFQSGIHNHTVCAVIGQLKGQERNYIYQAGEDGALAETRQVTLEAGESLELDEDVIHRIENPGSEVAHALHLYGGDFDAIAGERSLWSWGDHKEKPFSFPELLKESVTAMHESDNAAGLEALVEAIPVAKGMVETLTK